jgi:hypothetical protein
MLSYTNTASIATSEGEKYLIFINLNFVAFRRDWTTRQLSFWSASDFYLAIYGVFPHWGEGLNSILAFY